MARTKLIPTRSPIAEDDFPPLDDAMPTEMVDSATEPPSDPPATPQADLLQRLRREADANTQNLDAEWLAVVAKLATDTASDVEVEDILLATGKTITDLSVAVERQREIDRLQAEVAAYPERMREHQRLHAAHMELHTRKKIREFTASAEAENRQKGAAAYTASQALQRSHDAQGQLSRLLGREVSLPSIEHDAAPETMLPHVVDDAAAVVAEVAA